MNATDKVIDAARELLAAKFDTMRNGHGIEADDGEKCWIVHSDQIFTLQNAIEQFDKAPTPAPPALRHRLNVIPNLSGFPQPGGDIPPREEC